MAEVRGKPRVVAACARAANAGITVGMSLAEARAYAGDLVAAPYDEERLARAAREVTATLLAASPRIAWERGLGVWWVDAAGLGDEAKLSRRLARLADGLDYGRARAGVADSAIAAYAATLSAHRRTRTPTHRAGPALGPATGPSVRCAGAPVIVPPGTDAAFLAPFPVGLLDLDDELVEHLHALGLTTVGQVAALHADEVEARFGPAGLVAHRLARGLDGRGPSAPRDETVPAVACDLGSPVASSEPLLFVLKGALRSLGTALRGKGLAARELTLTLTLDDGGTSGRAVRPARPTSHEGALFDHLRTALDDWQLPEPVTALALRATDTVPASGEQGDLLATRWADPAALEAAFDRIRAREGELAVVLPMVREGHLPGDSGAWGREPCIVNRAPRLRPTAYGPRSTVHASLRLLPDPEPVRVRLGRAGLSAFRRGDAWHDVEAWSGPERLAPRWWTQDLREARDYYAARTRDGALWMLFRGTRARAWFLEGWWD